MQIHLSNNEKYVVLTYSESILILRLDGLEQYINGIYTIFMFCCIQC